MEGSPEELSREDSVSSERNRLGAGRQYNQENQAADENLFLC
jgi:hypothetical protein